MKKMKLFAPVFAVLLLCMTVQVVRGDATALALSGGKYYVTELQSVIDHAAPPVVLAGRPAHLRYVWRITQIPASAANTAVLSLDPANRTAYTVLTLPAVTHTHVGIIDLPRQKMINNAVVSTQTNSFAYILRPGDTLSIQGSTNSATLYRIEHVDIPQ